MRGGVYISEITMLIRGLYCTILKKKKTVPELEFTKSVLMGQLSQPQLYS